MRRALVLLAALALAPASVAQQSPGPTALPEGVAHGGLAARAGGIRLNRKVKAEMKENAAPQSRVPVLKGGKMRTPPPPQPNAIPKRQAPAKAKGTPGTP